MLKSRNGLVGFVDILINQLTDVAYFSGCVKFTQDSMKDYSRNRGEITNALRDYLQPYDGTAKTRRAKEETREDQALRREKLMTVLESNSDNGAFKSLKDILDTLNKVKETIGK